MGTVFFILLTVSLMSLAGSFVILVKVKNRGFRGVSRILFYLSQSYLLFHSLVLLSHLVFHGWEDFPALLLIGEALILIQTFLEYTRRSHLSRKILIIQAATMVGAAVFLVPLIWMISTALKPTPLTMTLPPQLLVDQPHWENFIICLNHQMFKFTLYARNTLYMCILSVTGTLLSCSLVAYGFSRIKWKGRDVIFYISLATLMIPFPVVMIPLFRLFRTVGWVGTFKPLWVPAFFGSAFHIFLMRQFFIHIPDELSEAAYMDGANHFWIWWKIVIPLARPALLVSALFQFLYTWNDFLGPLIFLTDQNTFTLSLGLQFFQSRHGGTEWNLLMAASTLSILPVILLFFLAQKAFIKGVSMTGLQG